MSEEEHTASRDLKQAVGGVREPWKAEPEAKDWVDLPTGYPCLLLRNGSGAWCGYVGVPIGHPAHGLSCYSDNFDIQQIIDGDASIIAKAKVQLAVNQIEVHGGLTFCGERESVNAPKDTYWFGFDCSHAGDHCPDFDRPSELGRPTGWGGVVEYRDIAFATAQTESLAAQLKRIAEKAPQ